MCLGSNREGEGDRFNPITMEYLQLCQVGIDCAKIVVGIPEHMKHVNLRFMTQRGDSIDK